MTYEKHNWSCGETVTADLLNHLEEGVADAANGYYYSKQVVFNDSVTTAAVGGVLVPLATCNPSAPLSDTIEVEFDGTTYTVTGRDSETSKAYGAIFDTGTGEFDWSQYPFVIDSDEDGHCAIATQTAGTYTLKITSDVITVTDEFKAAVQAALNGSGGGDDEEAK